MFSLQFKSFLFTSFFIVLQGCATVGPGPSSIFNNDQSPYDVICANPKQAHGFDYYLDSVISSWTSSKAILKDSAGNRTSVDAKECIFERGERLRDRPSEINDSKIYQVICKLGDAMFMDSNLQRVEQNETLNFVRRFDGHVWFIPKKICPLIEQSVGLGG